MILIETSELADARVARRIQFSGIATKFQLSGLTYSGLVISVSENRDSAKPSWTIKLKEDQAAQRVSMKRPRRDAMQLASQ